MRRPHLHPLFNMPHVITAVVEEAALSDRAAALAFFLLDNVGSVFGHWAGKMPVADQRRLLGRVIGKGVLIIDGTTETVDHNVSVSFGTMRASVLCCEWKNL